MSRPSIRHGKSVLASRRATRLGCPSRSTPLLRRLCVEALEDRRLLSVATADEAMELFRLSPALFVENQGQWADESVRYLHQGDGASVAMTDTGPVFQLFQRDQSRRVRETHPEQPEDAAPGGEPWGQVRGAFHAPYDSPLPLLGEGLAVRAAVGETRSEDGVHSTPYETDAERFSRLGDLSRRKR